MEFSVFLKKWANAHAGQVLRTYINIENAQEILLRSDY